MPGLRQRLAERSRSRERAVDDGPLGYGPEVTDWLRDWAWGGIPAAAVARKAIGRARTGCAEKLIKRLASCKDNLANAQRVVESIMPRSRFPPMQSLQGA